MSRPNNQLPTHLLPARRTTPDRSTMMSSTPMRPAHVTSPPVTPPPRSRSKGLDETYDELEKMLHEMNAPKSPPVERGDQLMDKADGLWSKGVSIVENGMARHANAQANIAMVKKGYDLVNSATNGEIGKAITNVLQSPAIERAIHIADGLVDLGKTLPFVAPIFTVLKVIIDVEQKARDAASKCEDLLERINFMTSQLLVLKKVKIIETVQSVVARMEKVLKEAASLIVAYRKQGPIARRLNMGNKDKFIGATSSIKVVTDDLMLTLQVQHTAQMDVLERAVPQDPEDEAAEEFVKANGGEEAVKANPQLVAQFAQSVKLTMDDTVMLELQSSISDLLQEQTDAINHLLQQNVTAAVVDGIKGFATELKAAEDQRDREAKKICVQCTEYYRETVNTESACKFHLANYVTNSRDNTYPCCGRKEPCKENYHRSEHHCEWHYGAFYTRSQQLLNYTDTVEWFSNIEEKDYEDESHEQKVGVGKVVRWTSRASMITEAVLLIRVGYVWYQQEYFMQTYTPEKVDEIIMKGGKDLVIAKIGDDDAYAMAEWMRDGSGGFGGIRVVAKVKSSPTPTVHEMDIDFDTMEQIGETRVVSEARLKPFKPLSAYTLPETIRTGGTLTGQPARKVRTDFKTISQSASLSLVITPSSNPPLVANPQWAYIKCDQLIGTVSIFNKSKTSDPATIMSVKAHWRLVGDESDKDWKEVTELEVNDPQHLPFNIDSRQSITMKFTATVPRNEEDCKKEIRWYNKAFVARHRPLRLRLTFVDLEGEEASSIMEYIFQPYRVDEKKDEDFAFFHIDHFDLMQRFSVRVDKDSWGENVIRIPGKEFNVASLNQIVYQARKSGVTEVNLEINHKWEDAGLEWNAWALVDLSCLRVYALKIRILEVEKDGRRGGLACFGYVAVPVYGVEEGKEQEGRPISYAEESVGLPELETVEVVEYKDEDGLDDIVPEPPKLVEEVRSVLPGSAPIGMAGGPVSFAVPEVVEKQFVAIGGSLEKLAAGSGVVPPALEKKIASIDKHLEKMAEQSGVLPPGLEARLASIDGTLGKIADAGLALPPALEVQLSAINKTLGEVAKSAAINAEVASTRSISPVVTAAPVLPAAPAAEFPPGLEKQLADLNDNLGAIAMTAIANTKAPAPVPAPTSPAPAPTSPGLEKQLATLNRNLENLALNAIAGMPPAAPPAARSSDSPVPASPIPNSNPTFDRRLASIDLNLERIASAMPTSTSTDLDERLVSIDRSLSRMADAFERMVGVLGNLAETQNAVEALVGVMGKFADRD
ncbi:hypothetical protein HK097_007078 [Rhizophlyctis rosea]|uniref:Mixed lineage kinase domain-containing protein n=1 Tax=Rhizophlyctis rosea TaxID=64517 RepID=A0AAD5SCH8_9FUNG|nr:hypothetical protein HK097_007078 [Rhizophlyctis rosea]